MNRIASISIILVILALGVWYAASRTPVATPLPETPTDSIPSVSDTSGSMPDTSASAGDNAPVSAYTIRYTAEGFSPARITVPRGTTVTFINQSGRDLWVGSDEHPSHMQYAGTNRSEHCIGGQPSTTAFDQCGTGQTYTFTFTKTGTWGYHNHVSAQHKGTVVVE